MPIEGKGPIVIPCYVVGGVPYIFEVDANGKLALRAAEIETLLAGGLPAALDSGALKVKEQSPISGFATSAKQDTMITALQLIDDLRTALLTVATDRLGVRATELETLLNGGLPAALDSGALKVKEQSTVTVQAAGGDKLLSIEAVVNDLTADTNLAGGAVDFQSGVVPTGKVWVITILAWVYTGTPPTLIIASVWNGATHFYFREWRSITSGLRYDWTGQLYLWAGEAIRMGLANTTAGDDFELVLLGYQMDAP